MPPLSLLIKPASSSCNLRCKYCFYHSIADSRNIKSYGVMTHDLLELLVRKSLEEADGFCTFAFQGGEPSLAGLDFYRSLIKYVNQFNKKAVKVNYCIQTNGMVIDDAWAEFLFENNFLTGISLDGPKDIHDANRVDNKGSGSYNQVMRAIGLLNKHRAEYNILTVITSLTARHIQHIYRFFKKQGFNYLQFIPCLDPLDEIPGENKYSLTPERYTRFLKVLFDLWYDDVIKGDFISIRYFDNLVGMLMGYPPESCGMSGVCTCYYVVEADGSTYPCDFYVLDDYRLGSIRDNTFEKMKNAAAGINFVNVSKNITPECQECQYYNICRGGCRRNREPFENGLPVLNYYCSSYKEFFSYSLERLQHLARLYSK